MKGLLQKLLQRKGIESLDEMSKDEKIVFQGYEKILSKETLTIEDIKKFLETQTFIIESKWKDYDTTNQKKAELIPYHTCYKTLLSAIDAPLKEKEALEMHLNQIINA